MKVAHLNHTEKEANVKVGIKGNSIEFTVINNEDILITSYMNLTKEIIYMDDDWLVEDALKEQEGRETMSKIMERLINEEKIEAAKRMLERGKLTKEEVAEDLDLPLSVVEDLINKLQLA